MVSCLTIPPSMGETIVSAYIDNASRIQDQSLRYIQIQKWNIQNRDISLTDAHLKISYSKQYKNFSEFVEASFSPSYTETFGGVLIGGVGACGVDLSDRQGESSDLSLIFHIPEEMPAYSIDWNPFTQSVVAVGTESSVLLYDISGSNTSDYQECKPYWLNSVNPNSPPAILPAISHISGSIGHAASSVSFINPSEIVIGWSSSTIQRTSQIRRGEVHRCDLRVPPSSGSQIISMNTECIFYPQLSPFRPNILMTASHSHIDLLDLRMALATPVQSIARTVKTKPPPFNSGVYAPPSKPQWSMRKAFTISDPTSSNFRRAGDEGETSVSSASSPSPPANSNIGISPLGANTPALHVRVLPESPNEMLLASPESPDQPSHHARSFFQPLAIKDAGFAQSIPCSATFLPFMTSRDAIAVMLADRQLIVASVPTFNPRAMAIYPIPLVATSLEVRKEESANNFGGLNISGQVDAMGANNGAGGTANPTVEGTDGGETDHLDGINANSRLKSNPSHFTSKSNVVARSLMPLREVAVSTDLLEASIVREGSQSLVAKYLQRLGGGLGTSETHLIVIAKSFFDEYSIKVAEEKTFSVSIANSHATRKFMSSSNQNESYPSNSSPPANRGRSKANSADLKSPSGDETPSQIVRTLRPGIILPPSRRLQGFIDVLLWMSGRTAAFLGVSAEAIDRLGSELSSTRISMAKPSVSTLSHFGALSWLLPNLPANTNSSRLFAALDAPASTIIQIPQSGQVGLQVFNHPLRLLSLIHLNYLRTPSANQSTSNNYHKASFIFHRNADGSEIALEPPHPLMQDLPSVASLSTSPGDTAKYIEFAAVSYDAPVSSLYLPIPPPRSPFEVINPLLRSAESALLLFLPDHAHETAQLLLAALPSLPLPAQKPLQSLANVLTVLPPTIQLLSDGITHATSTPSSSVASISTVPLLWSPIATQARDQLESANPEDIPLFRGSALKFALAVADTIVSHCILLIECLTLQTSSTNAMSIKGGLGIFGRPNSFVEDRASANLARGSGFAQRGSFNNNNNNNNTANPDIPPAEAFVTSLVSLIQSFKLEAPLTSIFACALKWLPGSSCNDIFGALTELACEGGLLDILPLTGIETKNMKLVIQKFATHPPAASFDRANFTSSTITNQNSVNTPDLFSLVDADRFVSSASSYAAAGNILASFKNLGAKSLTFISDSVLRKFCSVTCDLHAVCLLSLSCGEVLPPHSPIERAWKVFGSFVAAELTLPSERAAFRISLLKTPKLLMDISRGELVDDTVDDDQFWQIKEKSSNWVVGLGETSMTANHGKNEIDQRARTTSKGDALACNYCNEAVTGPNAASLGARRPNTEIVDGLIRHRFCLNLQCQKDPPQCALCGSPMKVLAEVAAGGAMNMMGGGRGPRDEHGMMASTSTMCMINARGGPGQWLSWCTLCLHGGCGSHMNAWFEKHSVCPVADCSCMCNANEPRF